MRTQRFTLIIALTFSLIFTGVNAQVQTARYVSMIKNSKAYYEYVPQGYPASGTKYPVFIFLHGLSECGPGSPGTLPYVLRYGPPMLISKGLFPTSFTVNNTTFKVIVISPQFIQWPTEDDIDKVINFVVAQYPVDINRIYLTGLSMGGGTVWNYSGNDIAHAKRLAGIFPVAGAGYPYASHAANMAAANLPVWATHNYNDQTAPTFYTTEYVRLINSAVPPPNPLAKKTIFQKEGHDAWTTSYDPNFRENGLNMYEYMLQFKRSQIVVLPVTGLTFDAAVARNNKVSLEWSTVSEIDNPDFKVLRSDDGVNFTSIATINSTAVDGAGGRYSYLDLNPFPGVNYYRLEMQEAGASKTYSDTRRVQVTKAGSIIVYPNPAQNVLHISNPGLLRNVMLTISNSGGQAVYKETVTSNGNLVVDISRLQAGSYFGELNDPAGGRQVFQFVKK